jgi:hypothetical protein
MCLRYRRTPAHAESHSDTANRPPWQDRRPRPEHYLPLSRYGDRDRELVWQYCAKAIGIESP